MKEPLISVTMTTYNHKKYIAEAIQSILDQTFQDFELVIVNDGSTDNTEQIIKSFHDPRIKYIYQENQGPSACANTALRNAQGKYIALMSGDDVSYPNRLEIQYNEYIKGQPRILFSHCDFIDDEGKIIESEHFALTFFNHPNRAREEILRYFFFYGNYLNAVTCFTEKKIYNKLGAFDIRLLQLQDFDMWLRALIHGYEIEIIQQKLIKYRILSGNKNLSAHRIDSAERSLFESMKIYKRFFEISGLNFLLSAFPEINKYTTNFKSIDIPYIFTKLAYENNIMPMKYCARDIFFDNFSEYYYKYLKEKYYFSMKEFYEYTGWGQLYKHYFSKKWQIAVKLEKIARKMGLIYVLKKLLKM